MTWAEALAAVYLGDHELLDRFTVEEVRLPRSSAHFVGLALFECSALLTRFGPSDNAPAYLRKVARRLQFECESLELGKRTVYDQRNRPIGHRTVGTMWRNDDSVIDLPQELLVDGTAGLGFTPAPGVESTSVIEPHPRASARAYYNGRFVPHDRLTTEQIVLQRAQCQGISRSEMAEYLGWDRRRVERVRKQLDALRRCAFEGQTAQPPHVHAVEGNEDCSRREGMTP